MEENPYAFIWKSKAIFEERCRHERRLLIEKIEKIDTNDIIEKFTLSLKEGYLGYILYNKHDLSPFLHGINDEGFEGKIVYALNMKIDQIDFWSHVFEGTIVSSSYSTSNTTHPTINNISIVLRKHLLPKEAKLLITKDFREKGKKKEDERIDDLERRINQIYDAPGMPGCLEAYEKFTGINS